MNETLTPDQIQQKVIEWAAARYVDGPLNDTPAEIVIEALAMFRRGLSLNGYVFYQP